MATFPFLVTIAQWPKPAAHTFLCETYGQCQAYVTLATVQLKATADTIEVYRTGKKVEVWKRMVDEWVQVE